ncbi:hypothetical protein BVRB_3g068900 [Beta vulgaris subsp. vulgaris]|nr:hypothetical protein BVRB_3g068900 [Beta vulgaris subsp. vulgaris]
MKYSSTLISFSILASSYLYSLELYSNFNLFLYR